MRRGVKPSRQDIALGALYRFGAAKRLDKATIISLMVKRVGYSEKQSVALVEHWLQSEPFRLRRQTLPPPPY
jgi:hypothetical protein